MCNVVMLFWDNSKKIIKEIKIKILQSKSNKNFIFLLHINDEFTPIKQGFGTWRIISTLLATQFNLLWWVTHRAGSKAKPKHKKTLNESWNPYCVSIGNKKTHFWFLRIDDSSANNFFPRSKLNNEVAPCAITHFGNIIPCDRGIWMDEKVKQSTWTP